VKALATVLNNIQTALFRTESSREWEESGVDSLCRARRFPISHVHTSCGKSTIRGVFESLIDLFLLQQRR